MATKSTLREPQGRPGLGRESRATERARAASEPGVLALVCLAAWAVPGAAHYWLGRRQKAAVFFVALIVMFVTGILLKGRLFPFEIGNRSSRWPRSRMPGWACRGSSRS